MLGIHSVHTDQPNCVCESNVDNIITAKSIGALCIMETLIPWEMRCDTLTIVLSTKIIAEGNREFKVSTRRSSKILRWPICKKVQKYIGNMQFRTYICTYASVSTSVRACKKRTAAYAYGKVPCICNE